VSRNDHGHATSPATHRYLRKRSVSVRERPLWCAPVVTQIVTQSQAGQSQSDVEAELRRASRRPGPGYQPRDGKADGIAVAAGNTVAAGGGAADNDRVIESRAVVNASVAVAKAGRRQQTLPSSAPIPALRS
jgi:hypothetical protein